MKKETELCALLGNPLVTEILSTVAERGEATASEVSSVMGIHVATSVKYLSALYEHGILSRALRRTGRRPAYSYSLRSEVIRVEFSFSRGGLRERWESLCLLFETVKRLYGPPLPADTPLLEFLQMGVEQGFRRMLEGGHGADDIRRAETYLEDFARENFGPATAEAIIKKARKTGKEGDVYED